MKKVLTIALAAAALAGGVAGTSGVAQAADWGHGYYGHDRDYDHDRYDHDRYGRHDRGDWRWRGGYHHREVCRSYTVWNRYWHRYTRVTRCY